MHGGGVGTLKKGFFFIFGTNSYFPNRPKGKGGLQSCAAGAQYATFFVGHILLSHSSLGSTSSVRKMVGSQHAAKFAAMQTAPTFTLHFTLSGQVLTIFYTKPENAL